MSRQQRAKIDAMVRRPRPEGAEPEAPASVEELRSGFRVLMAEMLVPTGLTTRATTLGDRPALLVEPPGTPRSGTILYFHGGAFVVGSPETAMSLTGNLVTRTGVRSYSLDYRLAPEHPFPAAIDDCLSAYRALLDSGEDPTTIVFAGDSAGGGLAVTTCLAARDADLPLPAAIVTFSAGLDATRTGESMDTKADVDPYFTREGLEYTGAMYRAGQDPHHPLLSPAVSADLTGLPLSCCRRAPTKYYWTTPPAWPPARGTPGWTSSSTSPPTSRMSSSPSRASWTRRTRRWTGQRSSSVSGSGEVGVVSVRRESDARGEGAVRARCCRPIGLRPAPTTAA